MTRIVCFALSFLSVLMTGLASAEQFDVRHVRWGMSPSEVRASEGRSPLEQQKEGMVFKTDFLGSETLITYFFAKDQLVAAAYIFQASLNGKKIGDQSSDSYLQAFAKLETMMRKKYGDPMPGNEPRWTDEQYRDQPKMIGTALEKGHVTFVTDWETPTTEIKLALRGGDGSVLAAVYSSKNLRDLIRDERKIKEAIALDDL